MVSPLWGDVRGTTGDIRMDANSDGAPEAVLTSTGLGIGTTTPSTNLHVLGNAILTNGNVGIGTVTPMSSLEINGSMGCSAQTITGNVTGPANTILLTNTSSSNIQVDLPYAGNVAGRMYYIKKTSNSYSLYVGGGGNFIDNDSSLTLTSANAGYPYVSVISDGRQWYTHSQSTSGLSSGIAGSNLIAWWKFDETSGNTAADSSSYGYHGTLTGNIAAGSGWTGGKVGGALQFNGSNDYVNMPNDTNFDTSERTVCLWFNQNSLTSAGTSQYMFSSGTGSPNRFYMKVDNDDQRCQVGNSGPGEVYVRDVVSAGVWYHVALTYTLDASGNTARVYFNGGSSSNTASGFNLSGASNVTVGSFRDGSSNWFNGKVDDVRVYNRALSADEIKAIYDATK